MCKKAGEKKAFKKEGERKRSSAAINLLHEDNLKLLAAFFLVWAWLRVDRSQSSPSAWERHKEMETRSSSAATSLRKRSEFQDNAACKKKNNQKYLKKLYFKPACR